MLVVAFFNGDFPAIEKMCVDISPTFVKGLPGSMSRRIVRGEIRGDRLRAWPAENRPGTVITMKSFVER